ncbi:hypothetical protein GCM10027160_09000 [Streptomyces calidiresistens]|uniref:hypothetical protein n=1 Tax=Streptomyces calidiresistens TaxID=1485586 RepID=UPI0015FB5017|nr:hypothetical protein [Streptomyces calidiresistens]
MGREVEPLLDHMGEAWWILVRDSPLRRPGREKGIMPMTHHLECVAILEPAAKAS